MSTADASKKPHDPPPVPRYSGELLRRLRNEIPIDQVIRLLKWPHKQREGRFVFLCPLCGEFLTGVKRQTNLGRCFACQRNFNPIDFTIQVRHHNFVEAVEFLLPLLNR